MSNYTGVRCPVCSKRFAPGDDVVVCPQCGAPHHRECYMEKKECAFASEHMDGKVWQRPVEETGESGSQGAQTQICPRCGTANLADNIFCQVCGVRLTGEGGNSAYSGGASPAQQPPPYQRPQQPGNPYGGFPMQFDPRTLIYGGLSPDEKIGDETVQDLATYIGPNSAYYLNRFNRFSKNLSKIAFNFSALFFNFLYYFYRKMYLVGGILLAMLILTMVPYFLYAREILPEMLQMPEFTAMMSRMGFSIVLDSYEVNYAMANLYAGLFNVMFVVELAAIILSGFFANTLYYRKVMRQVSKIRQTYRDSTRPGECNTALAYRGGTNVIGVFLGVASIFVTYWLCSLLLFSNVLIS